MEIQERRRGKGTYYYLVHSYRDGHRVRKLERYLGRRPPRDLDRIREGLLAEVLGRQWNPLLERVRADYQAELRRMAPVTREKELETFAIRFTYNTNRIEGSALTLRETAELLDRGITPSHRVIADVQETVAHRRVFREALTETGPFDLARMLRWHRELFKETKPDLAGKVRAHGVRIRGSAFVPPVPIELDLLLREYFDWVRVGWSTIHPVVFASLAHLRLVTIHPFADGNGRISRLAMNFVLFRKGYPMLDIPYEKRSGYYRALERSQIGRDDSYFVRWFLRRYVRETTRTVRRAPHQLGA